MGSSFEISSLVPCGLVVERVNEFRGYDQSDGSLWNGQGSVSFVRISFAARP
jgi:hypothetical protein